MVLTLKQDESHWSLKNHEDKLQFSVGFSGIEELRKGIQLAESGEYDFSIGKPSEESLWFW